MTRITNVSKARLSLNIVVVLTVILVCGQQAPAEDTQSDIFGKKWTLTEIEGRKFSFDAPNIEFNRDQNRISGDAGCNRFSGGFEIDGAAMKFSRLISTKRACVDAERQRLESDFLRLLETITRFEVQDKRALLCRRSFTDGAGRTRRISDDAISSGAETGRSEDAAGA